MMPLPTPLIPPLVPPTTTNSTLLGLSLTYHLMRQANHMLIYDDHHILSKILYLYACASYNIPINTGARTGRFLHETAIRPVHAWQVVPVFT